MLFLEKTLRFNNIQFKNQIKTRYVLYMLVILIIIILIIEHSILNLIVRKYSQSKQKFVVFFNNYPKYLMTRKI